MYGENEHLTIVSPAPGRRCQPTASPASRSTPTTPATRSSRRATASTADAWRRCTAARRVHLAERPARQSAAPGSHRTRGAGDRRRREHLGREAADFTLTDEPRPPVDRARTGPSTTATPPTAVSRRSRSRAVASPGATAPRAPSSPARRSSTTASSTPAPATRTAKATAASTPSTCARARKLWNFEVPQSIHGSLAVADGLVFAPDPRLRALRRRRRAPATALEGGPRAGAGARTTSAPTATTPRPSSRPHGALALPDPLRHRQPGRAQGARHPYRRARSGRRRCPARP